MFTYWWSALCCNGGRAYNDDTIHSSKQSYAALTEQHLQNAMLYMNTTMNQHRVSVSFSMYTIYTYRNIFTKDFEQKIEKYSTGDK